MQYSGGTSAANHLCVLVHGLWGNPNHMKNIARTLRSVHSEDQLHILIAKRNTGSFTYDGIELGGERVFVEIEEELDSIRQKGGNITKLSVVGYSLGGLVARYAVGLLEARGVLDRLEPMTFTTFASPHLGVRTPIRGWTNHVWNVLGARTLSTSGRQLFTIDNFRGTGRPLLSVMADPKSIFMAGLRKFKRRTLYSNIVNDRSVASYTSAISKTDPYTDLTKIQPKYLPGYEDVILDPSSSPSQAVPKEQQHPKSINSATASSLAFVRNGPTMLAFTILIPIGVMAYLFNSVVQNARSSIRIRRHNQGLAGIAVEVLDTFRGPVWVTEMREAVEDAYETLNNTHDQAYLTSAEEAQVEAEAHAFDGGDSATMSLERQQPDPPTPTLALAPHQFAMISSLDQLGWRKYPVWIHKDRHSHAAIIRRMDTPRFSEGEVVLRHWLTEEFLE